MHKFKKACCALMAGALTVSVLAATGCWNDKKMRGTSSKETGIESSDSVTEGPALSDPTDGVLQDQSSEAEAKALAMNLGLKEEDLRGRYDLFLEFADIVTNNPKLFEYRGFVIKLFPMVADHLDAEDEEYFLSKLKDLLFESVALAGPAGEFFAWEDKIRIFGDGILYENEATASTVMHELTHFVDAFADGKDEGSYAWVNGRLAAQDELSSEEWIQAPEYYQTSFITEGGAELYNAKYFSMCPTSYELPTCFLTGFERIYGSEALDDLFFSSNTTAKFVDCLKDAGYSDSDILDVIRSFNAYTYDYNELPEHAIRMEDVLIDLYEHAKDSDWKEDKVFCQILVEINQNMTDDVPLKHEEVNDILQTRCDLCSFLNNITDQIDQGSNPKTFGDYRVMIIDDKPYLSLALERTDEDEKGTPRALLVDYDYDTEKVLSYEYFVRSYPMTLPQPLTAGKELDDRLSSLVHDSTALHNQTAYSGKAELQALYDRAAQIGNKYGVYIRLGEDLPEYAEPYVYDLPEEYDVQKISDTLDHVENALSKFPEDFFDQLNYGYYKGLEIDVFRWPLYQDLNVFWTEDGYVMAYSMNCLCTDDLDMQEQGLVEAIFTAADLRIRNYNDNFEDPSFSEQIWKEKNPENFYYSGYMAPEFASEYYDEFKNYVISEKSMISAKKDRPLLMEALVDNKDMTYECIEKAEFFSQAIRDAFDDSAWPEKTSWEAAIDSSKADEKAA